MLAELLEGRLIEDCFFAADYDALPATIRGGIKTAVARAHALFSPATLRTERRLRLWEQGFGSSEGRRPADWTLICLDGAFASIPRLLAALMPAFLAGVPEIAVVRAIPPNGVSAWPPGLLAALELAGQEWAANSTSEEIGSWLTVLGPAGAGRCVFLGAGFEAPLAVAAQWDIPARLFSNVPRIGVVGPEASLHEAVREAHPDAEVVICSYEENKRPNCRLDAIFCRSGEMAAREGQAPLLISPEHAWAWHFSALHPGWFFETSLALWREAADEGIL